MNFRGKIVVILLKNISYSKKREIVCYIINNGGYSLLYNVRK